MFAESRRPNMPAFPGPAVLRMWCQHGHPIGSLIDIVTDDALATFVPSGSGARSWPDIDDDSGRRASDSTHRCATCSAEFVDSVAQLAGALHLVRADPARATGDVVLPPAPPAPVVAARARPYVKPAS